MRWNEFCSYRLSMLGRQTIKQHVIYERNSLIKKLCTAMIVLCICGGLAVYLFFVILDGSSEYSDQFTDLCVAFTLTAFLALISFFCLMRFGFSRCLSRRSDLNCLKRGAYRVDTIYVAGAYRPGRSGGYAVIRTLFEGRRDYVNGSVDGMPVHAVNLGDQYENGTYHPCLMLDNNSIYVLPRTCVALPRKQSRP